MSYAEVITGTALNKHYNLPFVKNMEGICLVWYKFDHIIGQYNFAV